MKKLTVIESISKLPDEFSMDEIIERLMIIEKKLKEDVWTLMMEKYIRKNRQEQSFVPLGGDGNNKQVPDYDQVLL